MFKFNFSKTNTNTIIPSYTVSKKTIDYLPINKKIVSHDLNIDDLTDIVVELDNEIENLKIIKTKIEEILSNKRKTEIKKDDINKIYDTYLSVDQTIENKEIKNNNLRTQEDKDKKLSECEIKKENNESNSIQEKKDNENNNALNITNDQINIGKNINNISI